MGGFLDTTVNETNPGTESEVRCGQVIAGLIPTNWVCALVSPSGHRAAIGGSGATADFIVYTGGNGHDWLTIRTDENYWGTLDAYTPESGNDGDQAAAMVRDKLSTQATAVIVDLHNFGNTTKRAAIINKVTAMVNKRMEGRMVIFTYRGTTEILNPAASFRVQ